MSIAMDTVCFQCHLRRNLETARKYGDEKTATAFAKELMRVYVDLPEEFSSPELGPAASRLLQQFYGLEPDRMRKEKEESNRFVMERLDKIRDRIQKAEDPLLSALRFAILGNYLDFAALQGKVSFDDLEQMLEQADGMELDEACYQQFRDDLEKGGNVLYLTDNAGEIGFDRLFAGQISKQYPQVQITFCVRGGPTHNDATREDAAAVQLPFPVIDNGNTVGGTVLHLLSDEAKQALDTANVVIAKGMGNTETMYGCGYNVYYAFLVKCERNVQFFEKPMMTPMFIRDPGKRGT